MSKLLNDFWEWAQTSPDEFAKNGGKLKNGQEDFLFPKYDQLIGDAQNQIQTKKTSDSTITFFLMVMAIDNE